MRGSASLRPFLLRGIISALLIFAVVIAGCGLQVAGVGTGGTGSFKQMGGAIQGKTISLSGDVTVLTGGQSTPAGGTTGATGGGAALGVAGVTTDGTSLYLADPFDHTVTKVEIATGRVTTVAGRGGVAGGADGIGTAATFNAMVGITTDGASLYVADATAVRRIDTAGAVTTVAGSEVSAGAEDGIGAAARFEAIGGISTDGDNLYLTDNCTIRKVVISTGAVTTLAGTAGTVGSHDGSASESTFSEGMTGLTTDGVWLYVADGNAIRKVELATGTVTTLAGVAGVSGSTDGTGAAARFSLIRGITSDGTNLYVTEAAGSVRKIEISSGVVTTVAGGGGSSSGAGTHVVAPRGITTDGTVLYVADDALGAILTVR